MNVLVTGSSGLIGSALVARLAGDGHHVTRLVRRPGPTDVHWDPASGFVDTAGLGAAGPVDGIVHLAGAGIGDRRWSPRRRSEILDSRVQSTRLITRIIHSMAARPSVLVSASAIGVYGDRGDELLDEDSPPGSGFLADVCRAWEGAAGPAAADGVRTVLLRTGIVLSHDGGALAKQLPLFRLGLGGHLGSGRQFRSWITLADEVSAIVRCLEDPGLSGPVNAVAPEPVTESELATTLGRTLRRPAVVPVPSVALRLALGRAMADELLLSSQRVLPTRLLHCGFTFDHPRLDGALRSVLAPVGSAGP